MKIHETFQQTVQGEGFWAGTPVDFIRLSGCPIGCNFCDTGYANGGLNLPRIDVSITDLVAEIKSPRVVISGGEPFIHRELPALVEALQTARKAVHIETSGAYWLPLPAPVWITLSPKQHLNHRFPVQPQFWAEASEIKLVIATGDEISFYLPHLPAEPGVPVYLQPEWEQRDRTLPLTLELLRRNPGYRLSVQTHKYLGVQ